MANSANANEVYCIVLDGEAYTATNKRDNVVYLKGGTYSFFNTDYTLTQIVNNEKGTILKLTSK